MFLAVSSAGTRVALKVLPATTDSQVRNRFLKEVAAAQRVARFCTAQVLDAGIFERRPFIVSEYVNGPSLVEVVEQDGPRGGAALERIAVATLTALGAVHAAGMVHRDFKPANVLLGPDGPVVIDFGLATVPGMTTTGLSGQAAMGTPAYMAPEQLAGERVTAAADMWSWAVSMTFAGTGKLPFTGDSLTAMAFAILHGEPSVGRLPEPLGSLVRRCLDKDPAVRPSARDALSELVAAGAQPMGPLPPQAETRRRGRRAPAHRPKRPCRRAEPRSASQAQARSADGTRDKAEHARRSGRVRRRWRATALVASILLIGGAGGLALILSRQARRQSSQGAATLSAASSSRPRPRQERRPSPGYCTRSAGPPSCHAIPRCAPTSPSEASRTSKRSGRDRQIRSAQPWSWPPPRSEPSSAAGWPPSTLRPSSRASAQGTPRSKSGGTFLAAPPRIDAALEADLQRQEDPGRSAPSQ